MRFSLSLCTHISRTWNNANLEITLNTSTVFDWIAVNEVSSSSHLTKRLARYLNNVNSTAVVSLIFIFANGFTCRYIQCTDVRFADNLAARFLIRETIRRGGKQSREVVRGMDETPLGDSVHTSSLDAYLDGSRALRNHVGRITFSFR